eukprot:scaffold11619_cov17-Tisochrysis_lutea.AAC.2
MTFHIVWEAIPAGQRARFRGGCTHSPPALSQVPPARGGRHVPDARLSGCAVMIEEETREHSQVQIHLASHTEVPV